MKKIVLLALILYAPIAFANDHDSERPSDRLPAHSSGVIGHVTITICPVSPPGGCPSQPYQTTVYIFNEKHRVVEQVTTDPSGNFRANLKPGMYTVVPFVAGPPQDFPYARPFEVRVFRKRFTLVTINYSVNII